MAPSIYGRFRSRTMLFNLLCMFTCVFVLQGCASGKSGGSGENSAVTSVSLAPKRGGITVTQPLPITATVTGDPGAAGVSWSVSAGGTLAAQTTSSASFSASSAGVYTITATSKADTAKSASIAIGVTDLVGVATYHNNPSRDGANTSEYALTVSNVGSNTFGKLFSCTVDGAVYAQPLWVPNVTIGSAHHNVLFVATEHDSLYALDADANPCVQLWQANLVDAAHGANSGETPVPTSLVGYGDGNIMPEIGVTGTPVIDLLTGTLYVVSKSVIPSGPSFYQRLHAIDIATGSEKFSGPVNIAASYPGTGDGGANVAFSARQENERSGLALAGGVVYVAWSSHEDFPPYYGWVIGYDATTLAQKSVLNVTPNVGYGGIWMGGGAPAVDSNNHLYLITGNAAFDVTNGSAPNNDYGDSLLQLNSGLVVSSYFTPSDQADDYANDHDFGAGGAAIVINLNSGSLQHGVIGGGKDGTLYLLDGDNLGGLGDSNARQFFGLGHPIFVTGAFWNNNFYIAGVSGPLESIAFNSATNMFNTSAVSQSSASFAFPGTTPSISASGATNGIVWALDNSSFCTNESLSCGPAILRAYDATSLTTELWDSAVVSADAAGYAVKFSLPTVANGKVYVGTRGNNTGGADSSTTVPGEVDVYGLLPN